jgi:hypothetical protein
MGNEAANQMHEMRMRLARRLSRGEGAGQPSSTRTMYTGGHRAHARAHGRGSTSRAWRGAAGRSRSWSGRHTMPPPPPRSGEAVTAHPPDNPTTNTCCLGNPRQVRKQHVASMEKNAAAVMGRGRGRRRTSQVRCCLLLHRWPPWSGGKAGESG